MGARSFARSQILKQEKYFNFSVGNVPEIASGGESFSEDGYRYHVFKSSGTFTVSTNPLQVEVFMIAGGGCGGQTRGAGGGAGEAHWFSELIQPGSYTITIGAGGAGVAASSDRLAGNNGNNTSAFGYTVLGGGGGGGFAQSQGKDGGCGGGTGVNSNNLGGQATGSFLGSNGGAGLFSEGSGGGGGVLFAGQDAYTDPTPDFVFGGNGGDGINFPLNLKNFYGGGGGGGAEPSGNTSATFGDGGIGGGVDANSGGIDAPANSGAGSGGDSSVDRPTGNGGSGIVIVRY